MLSDFRLYLRLRKRIVNYFCISSVKLIRCVYNIPLPHLRYRGVT